MNLVLKPVEYFSSVLSGDILKYEPLPRFEMFQRLINRCSRCEMRKTCEFSIKPQLNFGAEWLVCVPYPSKSDFRNGFILSKPSAVTRLLDKYLQIFGLTREQVSITPSVYCQTYNDLPPKQTCILSCSCWKAVELQMLTNVKYLLLLGNVPTRQMLGFDFESVISAESKVYKTEAFGRYIKVICAVHPAYLYRNKSDREITIENLGISKKILDSI